MISSLEKRYTKITTDLARLGALASCHPFTRQIDVIFPSECAELEETLTDLNTKYVSGKTNLAKILAAGPSFVQPYAQSAQGQEGGSSILALSVNHNAQDDDVWCIDTRGILTLCISKETYEKLGLVGQRVPFKHQSGEHYVISLPLHENADSAKVQARRRSALESWDAGFGANATANGPKDALGPSPQTPSNGMWDMVYCSVAPPPERENGDVEYLEQLAARALTSSPVIHRVCCEKTHLENIWVPNLTLISPRPQPKQEEELEDWEHDVSALFEWVGMAGLHAQRLKANDRIGPYVALYEPPTTSMIGNVTHLRWRGFLSPRFVQSVIDVSVSYLQTTKLRPTPTSGPLVAITAHGITNSPVVYLPQPRGGKPKGKSTSVAPGQPQPTPQPTPPAHLPRKDGEDTWCLILTPPEETKKDVKSILAESVGQWDARWG